MWAIASSRGSTLEIAKKQVCMIVLMRFFIQVEDGIRYFHVTRVQTCALPICSFSPALVTLGLPATQQAAIAASASHGTLEPAVLRGLAPEQVVAVQQVFAQSFMDGFHLALIFAGGVLLVAAVVANRFIPSGAPAHEGRPADEAVQIAAQV